MQTAVLHQPLDLSQEQLLVEQAIAGDINSFEKLYRCYANKIYLLCLRMEGRRDIAEEHMQEAFIKAWQALKKFEGKSRFGTWLYRIAVNVVLTHQRKHQYELYTDVDWEETFANELTATHSHQQIDLEKAIARLPMQAKNVLLLHDIVGMTHKEIGKTLSINDGTSKAHLSRARKLLKEDINHE